MIGGELLTGMTIGGALNARGEWIVGGVVNDLLKACREMGGFVEKLNDFLLIQYIAHDPEILKIAVAQVVYDAGVEVLLYTFADEVVKTGDREITDGEERGKRCDKWNSSEHAPRWPLNMATLRPPAVRRGVAERAKPA